MKGYGPPPSCGQAYESRSKGSALAIWISFLVLITVGSAREGARFAPLPDLAKPNLWYSWLETTAPMDACFGLARLLVVVLGAYLVIASLAVWAVHLHPRTRWARIVDLLVLPSLKRRMGSVLGVGLIGIATFGSVWSASPKVAGASANEVSHNPGALPAEDMGGNEPVVASGSPEAPVMVRVDENPVPALEVPVSDSSATWSDGDAHKVWQVRPGEHFWAIAESVVTSGNSEPVRRSEVVDYWRKLVAANRDRLADPSNPDLLFPGQEISIPLR